MVSKNGYLTEKYTALQVFNGLMLSDAGLTRQGRGCFLTISLSDTKELKTRGNIPVEGLCSYLSGVKRILEVLDIKFSSTFPKSYERVSHGIPYTTACLKSLNSDFLLHSYNVWYKGGYWKNNGYHKCFVGAIKTVPDNLELTPISVAYWFMGDGSANPVMNFSDEVDPRFHVQSFDPLSVMQLQRQLRDLGIETALYYQTVRGVEYPYLDVYKSHTDVLMDIISPFVVDPYRYKIQYNRKDCRPVRG